MKTKAIVYYLCIVMAAVSLPAPAQPGGTGRGGPGRPLDGRGGRFQHPGALCQDLTEEQRQQLRELVKGLREQGAGREEIHAAVEELFAEWGLEMPDGNRFAKRRFHHYIMKNLTREQRRQVRKVVRELRQNGATRKEIYDAVIELLQEWGIEPPEKPGDHGAANKKYPVDKTVDAMNYPNPFNPTTTINYQVAEPGHVTVEIYNIQGQFIRTLRDRFHEPGEFTAHWDGRDEEGRAVASGTFLYRINTPAGSVTKQMTLMK